MGPPKDDKKSDKSKPAPIKVGKEKTVVIKVGKEKAEKIDKVAKEKEKADKEKAEIAEKEKKERELEEKKNREKEDKIQKKLQEKEEKEAKKAKEIEDKRRLEFEKAEKKAEKKKQIQRGAYPFSDQLVRSFNPFRVLLLCIGRLPVSQRKKESGIYIYSATWSSFPGLYFLITTFILFYILIMGSSNLFIILMGVDTGDPELLTEDAKIDRLFERVIIKRHIVTVIVIWTALAHSLMTSVAIICKKSYMANYFSFWARAVDTMYMDVARGSTKYSMFVIIIYLSTIGGLVVMSLFRFGPSATGGPIIMGIVMFRPFLEEPRWLEGVNGTTTRTVVHIMGGTFFMLVFVSSKVYILVFLYECKLLRNAFANWNGRIYAAVLRGGDFIQNDRGRTTFRLLFKDHCVLLDLMEGTDRLFSMIIESYFGLQVCSICVEGYFMIRTAKVGSKAEQAADEFEFYVRPHDWAPGMLILTQSVAILIIVLKAAAEVGEEAMAGLEVIRRKTMLGRRTDEELYFMLSMYSSYTAYKKLELSAGGYFYLNKEFIIGIMSTTFSYFIILYQFQPSLDYQAANDNERFCIGEFLNRLEFININHLSDHHLIGHQVTVCNRTDLALNI